jgi:hypothetical protein
MWKSVCTHMLIKGVLLFFFKLSSSLTGKSGNWSNKLVIEDASETFGTYATVSLLLTGAGQKCQITRLDTTQQETYVHTYIHTYILRQP